MANDIDAILESMTIEEKAGLCSGADFWRTKPIPRLGIDSWMMSDGPHGLRKQKEGGGILDAIPATCFPSGVSLASTWNTDLIEKVGQAIGKEAKANQVSVVLGPAINIKRSPLCGRNFEYFSEDPYLAGRLSKHYVQGVQSLGVGTSLKHFAANNQEKDRMTIDAVVDERTLREIYLPAFECAVMEAQPWTVMCSYNRINGTYASENRWLLTELLKEEWGHTGIVVTDWGAGNDRVLGIRAGCELEMPSCAGITDADIVRAVKDGRLAMAELDAAVKRLLVIARIAGNGIEPDATYDAYAHHELARRVASESMVLLKNDHCILPLKASRIAFIGSFARNPRYQGGGSSHIVPTRLDDAFLEAVSRAPEGARLEYAQGYGMDSEATDPGLLEEAATLAAASDTAVVFIGLTDLMESEGYDRGGLGLPSSHLALIEAILAVQENVVVVLSNGSPVEMPWLDRVPAVLEGYLGGQAWGSAVADLLWGRTNPSGKLAETFPRRIEDTPGFLNFPGDGAKVEYREGVFVGYRYYDAAKVEPLFPFGHGMSYTEFKFGQLRIERSLYTEDEIVRVSVPISNAGSVAGGEVVQLYVSDLSASVTRPPKELKAFGKVFLEPGETSIVAWELDRRAFAFWSVEERRWLVETGRFELAVGSSSRDLRSSSHIEMRSTKPLRGRYDQSTALGTLVDHPEAGAIASALLEKLIPVFGSYEPGTAAEKMMAFFARGMPLRNVVRMTGGELLSVEACEKLCTILNRGATAEEIASLFPSW